MTICQWHKQWLKNPQTSLAETLENKQVLKTSSQTTKTHNPLICHPIELIFHRSHNVAFPSPQKVPTHSESMEREINIYKKNSRREEKTQNMQVRHFLAVLYLVYIYSCLRSDWNNSYSLGNIIFSNHINSTVI